MLHIGRRLASQGLIINYLGIRGSSSPHRLTVNRNLNNEHAIQFINAPDSCSREISSSSLREQTFHENHAENTLRSMKRSQSSDIKNVDHRKIWLKFKSKANPRKISNAARAAQVMKCDGSNLSPDFIRCIDRLIDMGILSDLMSKSHTLWIPLLSNPRRFESRIDILQDYCIKVNLHTLKKFIGTVSMPLIKLHEMEILDHPEVAVKKIIENLPASEDGKNHLANHQSLKGDRIYHSTMHYLGFLIVHAYGKFKLKEKAQKKPNFMLFKKYRRLHDSIRLIDILSSPEVFRKIRPLSGDGLMNKANPDTLLFLLKSPCVHRLPLDKLLSGHHAPFLSMSVEEIKERVNFLVNEVGWRNLSFEDMSIEDISLFNYSDHIVRERSEYWFKEFGKELVVSTPRASMLVTSYKLLQPKYLTMLTDDLSEDKVDKADMLKFLLGDPCLRGRSGKGRGELESLCQKHGWNFDEIFNKITPTSVSETLGLKWQYLCFDEANEIADYLLNEVKLEPEQVRQAPVILGLGLQQVKQIITKFKKQIDSPEWKNHPLKLDFVVYSYFSPSSRFGESNEDTDPDTETSSEPQEKLN